MKIYTKTGDLGETSLLGGARLPKSHLRIEAYGAIDELNSTLGLLRDQEIQPIHKQSLVKIQETLFSIGANLASAPGKSFDYVPEITEEDIGFLEKLIDKFDGELPEMKNFVLPGGHPIVSHCHIARCVCRRAERAAVRLAENEPVEAVIIKYLNRLSDYLFVLSRKISNETGAEELIWAPRK